jgi:flagellar P-ring protein precursor FlgI
MSRPLGLALSFLALIGLPHAFASGVPHHTSGSGTRLKDLARIVGIQQNALVGYGLIIGLPGTGDSAASLSTNRAVSQMLTKLGATASPTEVATKNLAAVIVTAELKPFSQIGDRVPVRVSSVGDAKSLQGGTLILTPLKGADGNTYALAQGHVSTGTSQAGAHGGRSPSESSIRTVALSDGGSVVRTFQGSVLQNGQLELSLMEPDFTTASRIAQAINTYYAAFIATAKNSGQISVAIPSGVLDNPSFQLVDFVATLEQIRVEPDRRARIVVSERTGTVVLGGDVTIAPVAISHGFLELRIADKSARTAGIQLEDASTLEQQRPGGDRKAATISELVTSLNALGAGPKDLVSILQALDRAGALNAQLEFM